MPEQQVQQCLVTD